MGGDAHSGRPDRQGFRGSPLIVRRDWRPVTSQLNSISASMVTILTVNVLGCFLLSELKLMREAMAPAMAQGSGLGPSHP